MSTKISLKYKLMAFFLSMSLIPLVILGAMAYNLSSRGIRNEVTKAGNISLHLIEKELDTFFLDKEHDAKLLSSVRDVYYSLSILKDIGYDRDNPKWQERLFYLDSLASNLKAQQDIDFFFITTTSGDVVYSTHLDLLDANVSGRDYIKGALNGKTTWSPFFLSDLVAENCLVVSSPVRDNGAFGDVIGTLNLVLTGHQLDSMVQGIGKVLGKTGNSYLINSNGLLLTNTAEGRFSQNAALIENIDSEAVRHLSSHIISGDMGFSAIEEYRDYDGEQVLGCLGIVRLGDIPSGLVIEFSLDHALEGVRATRNWTLAVGTITLIVVILLSNLISNGIAQPVLYLSDMAGHISQGDLTQRIQIKRNDELGALGDYVNGMIEGLHKLVSQISSAASEVTGVSQGLSSAAQEAGASIEQVATSSSQFTGSIQEMASNADQISQESSQVMELSIKGKGSIDKVIGQMKAIEENVKELEESIGSLGKRSKEIWTFLETIRRIADQTNLLALNATIEAARAGEYGRGFAVVADEVRKLAEETGHATERIEVLIDGIRQGTDITVQRMEATRTEVRNGSQLMDLSGEAFAEIVEAVQNIGARLQEMASSAEQLGAGSQEIAAATEEQSSSIGEVADMAARLSALAEGLQQQVSIFKI